MGSASEEAVVGDLIQLHLIGSVDAGDGQWSSPVVAALPTSRLGDMQQEEIAKFVPINKNQVPHYSHESTATKIYQWIMEYMEIKGYLRYTRVNARILCCELLKEWAYENRHLSDRAVDLNVACRYKAFVGHLLYFHHLWAESEYGKTRTKLVGQPHGIVRSKNKETFVTVLVKVHDQLAKLQQTLEKAENSETHCTFFLDQLHELYLQLLDQAATICFLGPAEHYEELMASHGDFSIELLKKHRERIQGHTGEVFWSTDWGRLLDASLRQGDPEGFKTLGAWTIFYIERGSKCKMRRYYSQAAAESRLMKMRSAAILLYPAPEYRKKPNWDESDYKGQAGPLFEAINAHLLAIGAKEPESNPIQEAPDGDLWEFLDESPPKGNLAMFPEVPGSLEIPRIHSESSVADSERMMRWASRRRSSTSSVVSDHEEHSAAAELSQELELVRAKWAAHSWCRSGLAAELLSESPVFGCPAGPDALVNVVLQMAEDLAALLQTERSILVPLKSVCMQLGTLQARRFLHLALAQLSLHVDQFVECAKQFHQIFEARLFDSLRQVDGPTAPAGQRPQKPLVQRSYRRAWQRAQALRREILKKVQKLGETVPLQSSEDEQFSIEKAQSAMLALAQALPPLQGLSLPGLTGLPYEGHKAALALTDGSNRRVSRQSIRNGPVLEVD